MENINQSESGFYGKSSEQHGTHHGKVTKYWYQKMVLELVNILFEVDHVFGEMCVLRM